MKDKCINCKKGFKILTEKDLCFYCHINKYKEFPEEFKPRGKYHV